MEGKVVGRDRLGEDGEQSREDENDSEQAKKGCPMRIQNPTRYPQKSNSLSSPTSSSL
jgi:hypothetical protein